MSSAKISLWKVGGLALLAVGIVYATSQINGSPAPPAEISPAAVTNDKGASPPSQQHFPTILRAKPVSEAPPTISPRYAPRGTTPPGDTSLQRDATLPLDQLQFDRVPAARYPLPTDQGPTTDALTTGPPTSPRQNLWPADGNEPVATYRATSANRATSDRDPSDEGSVSPAALSEPVGKPPQTTAPNNSGSESAEIEPVMPTTYVTIAQDSFWDISKLRYAGEGRYFKALFIHNRDRISRPDQIPAGIEIETPPAAELLRLYPEHCQLGQRR